MLKLLKLRNYLYAYFTHEMGWRNSKKHLKVYTVGDAYSTAGVALFRRDVSEHGDSSSTGEPPHNVEMPFHGSAILSDRTPTVGREIVNRVVVLVVSTLVPNSQRGNRQKRSALTFP